MAAGVVVAQLCGHESASGKGRATSSSGAQGGELNMKLFQIPNKLAYLVLTCLMQCNIIYFCYHPSSVNLFFICWPGGTQPHVLTSQCRMTAAGKAAQTCLFQFSTLCGICIHMELKLRRKPP